MKRLSSIHILVSMTIALVAVSSFATPLSKADLLQFKDQWVAASENDVLNAPCSRMIPFTDREMKDWLDSKSNEDAQKISINVHGIELVDESPYLAKLLQALLTQDGESSQPQRTFQSSCKKTYCVAKELFGERAGLQILYMLGRFGFNGSHLRLNDSSPWTSQELDTVLLSLSDLPKELISPSPLIFNRRLTHYQRGKPNPDTRDALASTVLSGIKIFDSWNGYSAGMQRYALYHELGHVFGYDSGLHASPSWYEASGWNQTQGSWIQRNGEHSLSKYAETNPIEDFAESFAGYRYNPEKLKESVPEAYDFLKTHVYKNVEYTKNGACNNLYPEPPESLAALDKVKDSILNHSASLSTFSLPDEEIERARQSCLVGPNLVSAFVSGKLLNVSAQCVRQSEIRKAIETAVDESTEFKGFNSEWLSNKLAPQLTAALSAPVKCTQNCQHLARKGLDQIEHALELVLVGYIDLGNGVDKQPVQKFCTDLSSTNVDMARGYPEIQELTGNNGTADFVTASVKVCKVIQSKFRKRQSMSAEQIEAALEQIYP